MKLFWYCDKCKAIEPVSGRELADFGDREKCITCTERTPGMAEVYVGLEMERVVLLRSKLGKGLIVPRPEFCAKAEVRK